MLSITSLLALLSVLLVSCQQVLALPISTERGLPTTITSAPTACTPVAHNYNTLYTMGPHACDDRPQKRASWMDGPLDYTKCMQGCDALLKSPNSTALEAFQGFSSILKNEEKPKTMGDQCRTACKDRHGGNGRRALSALRELRKRGMAPSVKLSRDQMLWLARRGAVGDTIGVVIGQQKAGKANAVAVPGSQADGCKYVTENWPSAGEWKDEKEKLSIKLPEGEGECQVNAYEGSVMGPDGKRYGICLPTEWNSDAACDCDEDAKFTAFYTCWVGHEEVKSPEQLLA